METREQVKDFYGKIIGYIDTKDNGDRIAKDFYGKILGKYRKEFDKTYDFYGKILSKGDITSALVWKSANK